MLGPLYRRILMNVVMIDGAIRRDHPCFSGVSISQYRHANGDWHLVEEILGTGHGTAVAGILIGRTATDIHLINFCVFDQELKASTDKLISALEFIDKNIETSIIHLSLGSLHDNRRLYDICQKLSSKNILIVAGFDNNGSVSFPAAYDCVIGVDTSFKCVHKNDFVLVENSMVNIRAMGGNQRVAWDSPDYIITSGTSFAAAHVTKQILNTSERKTLHQVLEYFKSISKHIYQGVKSPPPIQEDIIQIECAALLPFSKEIQSLLNFRDLLKFHIEGVYDVKYSGHIGLAFRTFDSTKEYIIENLEKCRWNAIDTFILGHIVELNPQVKDQILHAVIDGCIHNKVNLFCFDYQVYEQYKDLFHANDLQIQTPYAPVMNQYKFGKLYKINHPVLAVFGTTSKQGKFTLQLHLRKIFLQHQYRIGQLGTEPTALLFGMDDCFPFGYNSPMRDETGNNFDYIELVNTMLHQIDSKEPDLIITGCQSNITPILFSNLRNMTLDQIDFLMGTNPDAAILCVNPYDHFNYIQRSIQSIEGLSYAKVLAIALFPFTFENNWAILKGRKQKLSHDQLQTVKQQLEKRFGLPVCEIGNENDTRALFQLSVDYFSGK